MDSENDNLNKDFESDQKATAVIFRGDVADTLVLDAKCPLDYGRHLAPSSSDPGNLERLPPELQQLLLVHLDLESFLTFQAVSRRAMEMTNGIPEYHKVSNHAPDAIRMAVGIRTHHTFTLKALFQKLCQKECDDCGQLGPFIDVFGLKRVCLSINGKCHAKNGPVREGNFNAYKDHAIASQSASIDVSLFAQVPCFSVIPGIYQRVGWQKDERGWVTANFKEDYDNREKMYHGPLTRTLANLAHPSQSFGLKTSLSELARKSKSCTLTPWLYERDDASEMGSLCNLCASLISPVRLSDERIRFGSGNCEEEYTLGMELHRKTEWEKHMKDYHVGGTKKISELQHSPRGEITLELPRVSWELQG